MKYINSKHLLAAVVSLTALTAGCVTNLDDGAGRVSLPVTTTGGDGATYRMPAGTILEIASADFAATLPLDGDEVVAELTLPVGDYQAVLAHPSGYTTWWPLTRIAPEGTTVVAGELITAMPMPFSISEGQTTGLAVLLRVTNIGDVEFASGTLGTTIVVDTVSGPATDAHIVGIFEPDSTLFDGASPGLEAALTFGNGASMPMSVDVHLTAPWYPTGLTSVCAPVVAGGGWGEGHAGWQDLLAELVGGTGALCIDGTELTLYVRRAGAATSALALELPDPHGFWLSVRGELPASPYDGQTLALSPLAVATALEAAFIEVGIDSLGSGDTLFQSWGGTSTLGVQLAP